MEEQGRYLCFLVGCNGAQFSPGFYVCLPTSFYCIQVLPIFQQAGIKCTATITSCKNHAYDAIIRSRPEALMKFDGIIAIGGDGFFQEIMNGILDYSTKPGIDLQSLLYKMRIGMSSLR